MSNLSPRLASVALAAAGGLHAVAAAEHDGSFVTLAFFAVVAIAQVAGAIALALRPSDPIRSAVAIASFGLILLWAVSRTVGVSIGHEGAGPEAVGGLDGLVVAAQVIALLAVGWWKRTAPARLGPVFAAAAVPIAIAVGFAGSLLPTHAHHHPPATAVAPVARAAEPTADTAPPAASAPGEHGHVDEPGAAPHAHP